MGWNSSNWFGNNWFNNQWFASDGSSGSVSIYVTQVPATGLTYNPTISLGSNIFLSPNFISATGITYGPDIRISKYVSATTIHSTGLTYTPNIGIGRIVTIGAICVTGNTISPTLKVGSTIFVGTSLASANTKHVRINPSNGLGSSVDTTLIIESTPSIKKGILSYPGTNSVGVVLAGQIGLETGDRIVYLGNGQWKKL